MKDTMSPPLFLFAQQSPTLLTNLAQSELWRIETVDVEGVSFQEKSLATVPVWDGRENPVAFVGCHRGHIDWARRKLDGSTLLLHFFHHGEKEGMGSPCSGTLGLSLSGAVARYAMNLYPMVRKVMELSPWYQNSPSWSWREGSTWCVCSRPNHRSESVRKRQRLMESKASVKFFGEGQPMGFIGKDAKEKILSSCSGYVSAVGPEGGFGLMEHEAMAAGCPVVGRWWGDFSEDAPDHPGLFGTDEEVLEAAIRISKDRAYAGLVSEAGLAYIRQHRTREKLDDSILDLLVDMGLR